MPSPRRRRPSHSSRRRSRARQSKNRQYNRISKFRREPSPYLLPPYANTFSDYRRPQHYRPKPTPLPNVSERPLPLVDSEVERRFFEPLQKRITIETKEENTNAKFIKDNVAKMEQIQHYQEQGHFKPSGEYIPKNKKKLQVHQEALAHFASIINVTNTQEISTNSEESDEVQTTAEDYHRHYRKQTEEERQMLMERRRRLESHRKDTESGEEDLASYRRFLKEHEAQLRQERERLEAEERRELWERIRRREEERRLVAEETQRKKVNQMLEELNKKAENHSLLMDQAIDFQNDKKDNDWPIATTFQPRGFMFPHEINKALEVTKRPIIIPARRRIYNTNRRIYNKRPTPNRSQSQISMEEDENFKLSSAETAYYKKRQLNRMKTLVRNLDGPGSIPGVPGRDYPIYSSPPNSDFHCSNHKGRQGYFADVSTNCQVFFICSDDGHGEPVLCPNGTVFNQDVLVCDWWFNVNCQRE